MKKSILFLTFLFVSTLTFSQVTIIYYLIEYNESTDLFDCKMFVEGGTATSASERLQLDARYSVVVATGTTVTIANNNLPIYNNESYMGTVPMNWSIENIEVDPPELPGYDIISIVPDLSGDPSHYNDLECCDALTLFSLSVVGDNVCSLSVRNFDNETDPTNLSSGNDFTNTMMIGTALEIYQGNVINGIWEDVDITIPEGDICLGECFTLVPSFNCIFPGLTYEWSTGETSETITVCPTYSQNYYLNLFGPFGIGYEVEVPVFVDKGINTGEQTTLCVGIPVNYLPETGIWWSSDESIATVDNDGLVTPISSGTVFISHTNDSGNCLDEVIVTVQSLDFPTILGEDILCAGETSQLYPSVGVTWVSEDTEVATVDNSGLVTGVGWGSTVFTYTTEEGCISEPSFPINVLVIPEPKISGVDTICAFATTTLTPGAGVTWVSTDTSVAKVENDGTVTGISEGTSRFYFTDMATGCTSEVSDPVMVLSSPIVQLPADTVCQGESVFATTNVVGGTWKLTLVSLFFDPPTIDPVSGEIFTNGPGVVSVQYEGEDGCMSEEKLLTILRKPMPVLLGNSSICSGQHLTLSPTALPEDGEYTFEWTGPNGFSSNEKHVAIIYADESNAGIYTLVVNEKGCLSEKISKEVIVMDCNPCDSMMVWDDWEKVSVKDGWSAIGDYEIGGSLVTGRALEDFVYYHYSQFDVRLIKNDGNGKFDEEVVLFDLPYFGPNIHLDIVDIDQDGLKDIVTFQSENSTSNFGGIMTIKVFKNLDNYTFEEKLAITNENLGEYIQFPAEYKDIDNQGFLDIIPFVGNLHFTDNWEASSVLLPTNSKYILIDDLNEDGLLDVLGSSGVMRFFSNNGDRTFSEAVLSGDIIRRKGLYDFDTGVLVEGMNSFQITKGSIPSVTNCNDPGINPPQKYFKANINSKTKENGVLVSNTGFFTFELPITCENSDEYEPNYSYKPNESDKIDMTGNGYTDFITVENGYINAWINPNTEPKVLGTAFIDKNADGILNDNDVPLRNVLISIEPGNMSVLTDDSGAYQFEVSEGTYTITAKVNEGDWIMDELVIENIEVSEPCNLGYDFGFVPDPSAEPMVNLSMVNTIARCDFETKFTITVENTGTEPFESKLQFDFDDKTSFFSTEINGATVTGNKVTAHIGPLEPFQPQEYVVRVKMPAGSSVLPLLDFKASLLNEGDEVIKEYGYSEQLRCSYDPNDKRTFPDREGDENLSLMEEAIEYTIRFQNNGNDTAYNVKIIDPLDSHIDPSSIRVMSSSHSVETCIEGTDLIFLFEDIYLVDSMTNYALSQGYVSFKCNTYEGLTEFTPVHNTAEIIFDTNLPIVTNQTLNTMVSELCTDKSTIIDKFICKGDSYLGFSESGTYTESFELPFGCDSLVTINLDVQEITLTQLSLNVCEEGIITLGGKEYYIDANTYIEDTIYTDQGCISNINNYDITLVPDLIEIDGGLSLCEGSTASIFPVLDGVWSCSNESVLVITSDGNMTAVGPGEATLQFIDNESGCSDEVEVVVYPEPILSNEGSDQICINETSQLTSDTEGLWISSDTAIATISVDGFLVGKAAGSVVFTFTSTESLCSESIEMEVLPESNSNCIVSTNDEFIEQIIIYPNPSSGILFIESKEEWQSIRLLNTDGKVLSAKEYGEFQPKKRLDLQSLPSGLYFLYVERESGLAMEKVIVY